MGTNRRGATEGQDTRARAHSIALHLRAHIMFWNTKIARVHSVPPIPCIGIGITPIPVSASICCIDTSIIISQYRHLHGWYLYLYCSNGIVVSGFYHYEYWYQYDTFTSYIISLSVPYQYRFQYRYGYWYLYGWLSNIGMRIGIGMVLWAILVSESVLVSVSVSVWRYWRYCHARTP